MNVKVIPVATEDIAQSNYPPTIRLDRGPEIGLKPIAVHIGTMSAQNDNWSLNGGKGERGAASRIAVPLHAYGAKRNIGTAALTVQLCCEIFSSMQRRQAAGLTNYTGLVLIGEHDQKVYIGYCLVPPEFK